MDIIKQEVAMREAIDAHRLGITAEDLADALNECEGTSAHPWIGGHVLDRHDRRSAGYPDCEEP